MSSTLMVRMQERLQTSLVMIGTQEGLSSVWLLVFTVLLWLLFASIFLSNRKNQMNRWVLVAGIFFSVGVLKEYLYFGVVPSLLDGLPQIPEAFYTGVYSVMTAVLYYLAMPAVVMVALYFADEPRRHPRRYHIIRILDFLPAVLFSLIIPWHQTRYYQLNVYSYYLAVSVYNWIYGLYVSWLLLSTLYRSRLSHQYRQQCMIAVTVLLPMWYWLLSAFLIHSLKLYQYFKIWQGNLLIVIFLLFYFAYHLFKDGIWGSRLYRETYDLQSFSGNVQDNTRYMTHALKNEVTKIRWCACALLDEVSAEQRSKLQIILRSASNLENFMKQARHLSQDISLHISVFPLYPVLRQCVQDFQVTAPSSLAFEIHCSPEALIETDRDHLIEVLHNLLDNARDAVGRDGRIRIDYSIHPSRRCSVLAVSDNGCGIDKDSIRRLFQPYYTTKGTSASHLGLGLYYCRHVMEKQGGGIRVKSIPSQGSTFFLYFPYRKSRMKKQGDMITKNTNSKEGDPDEKGYEGKRPDCGG